MINERELIKEMTMLENSIERVQRELKTLKSTVEEPYMLRAVKHGNGYQYYLRKRGSDTNGRYIKKKEINKAVTLAQMEYDERLLQALHEAKRTMEKCIMSGLANPFETALAKMNPGKKELLDPHYISDEAFVETWREQNCEGLSFKESSPEFYTRSGIRVRSKSEVLIADILDEFSIPFLYEKPLKLKNRTVHPDFTLLNIKERKEVYWEHFGMMDDREYRDDAFLKIREYEANGYYQPDSVIWTFESSKYPVSTREIRRMIRTLGNTMGY